MQIVDSTGLRNTLVGPILICTPIILFVTNFLCETLPHLLDGYCP